MSATPQEKAKIGLIGLAVMGENLALNIARNGFPIAVYNRDTSKVDRFIARAQEHTKGKNVIGTYSLEEFVSALDTPRKIVLLVKAGEAVDVIASQLKPLLSTGDIIIDGGNSNYNDTNRREHDLKAEGLRFIGSGVSGGETGALWGPSLMPGGDPAAYEEIRPIWEKISAQVDDGACVTYVGPGGAGHFVKMVHNGIEYGDMQLIAEAYGVLKHYVGLSNDELAETFTKWNEGQLNSFLIEITSKIFRAVDPETGNHLVDMVVDEAGQKGTGKWTAQIAIDIGVPIPTMQAALDARVISAHREQRTEAAAVFTAP